MISLAWSWVRENHFTKAKFEKSRYADYMHHYRNYTLHTLPGDETKNEKNDQVFARGSECRGC